MKSEKEIRKHRDQLRKVLGRNSLEGRVVPLDVLLGYEKARSVCTALSWVLGENEEFERAVEHVAAEAQKL